MQTDSRTLPHVALTWTLLTLSVASMALLLHRPTTWAWGAEIVVRVVVGCALAPLIPLPLTASALSESRQLLSVAAAGMGWLVAVSFPHLLGPLLLPMAATGALATARFHRRGVALLFVGYAAAVLLCLVHWGSGLYEPRWFLGWVAPLWLCGFGGLLFAWGCRGGVRRGRWRVAVPTLLLGALAVWFLPPPLARLSSDHFVRRPDLAAFAAEVQRHGRITSMWEEDDVHELNHARIVDTPRQADSLRRHGDFREGDARLLADVLARDGIDPAVYRNARWRMRGFHFERLQVVGHYVLLGERRRWTRVYARPGTPPLQPGDAVPRTRVRVGTRRGQWYFAR